MQAQPRNRIAKAEPTPLPPVPPTLPVEQPPTQPTREELLQRLRSRRAFLRRGGTGVTRTQHPTNLAKAMETHTQRLAAGKASRADQRNFDEMQADLERCGGDFGLMCERAGVPADMVPDVIAGLEVMETSQGTQEERLRKAIGTVTAAMRKKGMV